ncbi:hypothetical protein MUK70_02785 [Dyadobacter chenwenxiniae]|uniref:Uncharacterized protein n=1 Tax=Dyadobacter chenwenxiniae TaxID=2906456 RepID=A0A9X1PLV6_9BACT|nr:hypothetical protein [Dyadobacter chenwenxiniae]MCF0062324.1 hypothetical protein [Dyadobacter chenwenxiniae]UON83920.1 hypothetical protein MUK70_02785 [Dyadobacter chenwenxiniae]
MLFKQTLILRVCFVLITCLALLPASAQHTLEFVQDGVNNSYNPPVPKGPTSIPQTLAFFLNNNGSKDEGIYFQSLQSRLSVTFSFDDQTYITVPQHVTGMTFGAASGASASQVKSVPVVNNNFFEDSTRTIFTAHPKGQAGRGVNVYNSVGVQIFLSAKPLLTANAPTSDTSRYYYGKLRLQFSRPVNNPVISLVGLGATTNFSDKRLGFATELELQSPGRTLIKLSGSKELVLDDTKTKILHTKSAITGNCGNGAACGSLMVTGSDVTSLVFGVYLRADGGPGVWGTQKVTNSGDMWHITVSLPEQ